MRKITLFLSLALFLTMGCSESNKKVEKYTADWESIQNYEIPAWFEDAKFGIFIHWGAYSVPAYDNEWYPRHMYQDSMLWHQTDPSLSKKGTNPVYTHHTETYGHPSIFGYKDFIPMFKAEKFDAKQWIDLFKKAGAKYVVPVAEHHDGFAMYNSHVTRWNAAVMGPKRDIIKELKLATANAGLKFGVSSHFAFNWDYYNHEERFDTSNPELADLYGPAHKRYAPVSEEFMDLWWRRTTDIIDSYNPDILWFDFYWDRPEFASYHSKLAAYYYNMGLENKKEVVLQSKNMGYESFPEGTNVLDIERGKRSDISKDAWQTDTSIGKNSWCYTNTWESKTSNSLLDDLIDIVSKNGTMLLNVGPKADGTIPQDQKDVLLGIGDWLATNGEAIYDTRPWKIFGEGPTKASEGHHSEGNNEALTSKDIRFTTKGDVLYATALGYAENGTFVIKSLATNNENETRPVQSVEFISAKNKIDWKQTENGLEINVNGENQDGAAFVFKVKF
ncbi:alpha-L-fucosidase [Labilibaculum antarcticum]|uniref:alpha-L-fucosidase n=1 Tax=Labilibaculum antarcticum TaxID=1717717 RepID=A0A1Y1CNZ4_9BACT|nr:alpha-L-fucosidase [Labilibaculum antarcticum]BAX82075.1 alpha-L-fucosidase [Labilibaculum antarcticum]